MTNYAFPFSRAARTSALSKIAAMFVVIVATSACSPQVEKQPESEQVRVVKLAKVERIGSNIVHRFPAQVSAVKTLDASFEVSGRVIETHLLTGAVIKKGDVIARVDPTPFNQRVSEARAQFNQASRNARRIQGTYDKGLTSQADLDNAKTALELAEISLSKAEKDLSYTTIRAPFDAQVSERFVENNSFVKAGGVVGRLQDVSKLHFTINVPERLVSQHREESSVTASARLIALPDSHYELKYVEHSTSPDPLTQTYRVVFSAQQPATHLPPGARAEVTISIDTDEIIQGVAVPFAALDGNGEESFRLWKYNEENNDVSSVMVKVLNVRDGFALVNGDIEQDSLIVAAGVTHMRDGMKVKPYLPEGK